MEAQTLETFLETMTNRRAVLSLGGETLTTERCRQLLQGRALCIYLKASEDTLVRNLSGQADGRPMLEGAHDEAALRARISKLMALRSNIYESSATHTVQVDALQPETIAQTIAHSAKFDHYVLIKIHPFKALDCKTITKNLVIGI